MKYLGYDPGRIQKLEDIQLHGPIEAEIQYINS